SLSHHVMIGCESPHISTTHLVKSRRLSQRCRRPIHFGSVVQWGLSETYTILRRFCPLRTTSSPSDHKENPSKSSINRLEGVPYRPVGTVIAKEENQNKKGR